MNVSVPAGGGGRPRPGKRRTATPSKPPSPGRAPPGRPDAGEPVAARLGDLREELDPLRLDREAFVERPAEEAPEKPPKYEGVVASNTGRETVDEGEATELELGPNDCAA